MRGQPGCGAPIMGDTMLRSVFTLALLTTLLCGSIATMAAGRYGSAPAADSTEAVPDRIADLMTVWW